MASREDDLDEYLPDSDDSDHQNERPNRWTGPPSTWQQLNSAEIDTLTALNQIRNQDLSIHLYNAFALRNRHKRAIQNVTNPVPNQDIDITTGQPVQEDKWVPPKSWTAWPLPVEVVPRPEFMKRGDDTDVAYRMQVSYTPKSELEEVISATMLRLTKEKFQARLAAQQGEAAEEVDLESGDEEGSMNETSSIHGRGRSTSRGRSAGSRPRVKKERSASHDGEMMDIDDPHVEERSSPTAPKAIPLQTVVATDDELSYALLRPTAQGILSQLDTTLTVLHRAQESRFYCPSESSASSASSRSQSRSRSRSRPRSRSQGPFRKRTPSPAPRNPPDSNPYSRASSVGDTSGARPEQQPSGGVVKVRGRPKKTYPRLEGETDRDYEVRIARLRKKPIPPLLLQSADADVNGGGNGNPSEPAPAPAPRSAAEFMDENNTTRENPSTQNTKTKTAPTRSQQQQQPRRKESSDSLSDAASTTSNPIPTTKTKKTPIKLSRVRLRDWRDVLGAAALAGFPAAAIDRAARRCASLFSQDFSLHTLVEGPAEEMRQQGHHHHHHMRYVPGMSMPAPSLLLGDNGEEEGDGDIENGTASTHARSRSRGRSRSRARSTSAGPSRSASASAGGRYFCVVRSCPRATDGFTRRPNLLRHLRLVHHHHHHNDYPYDGEAAELIAAAEVDSEDEMCGAVHVDGFLKPIKIRPGWVVDDEGKRRSRPRKRAREVGSTEEDEVEDMRMRDVDSMTGGETSG